MPEIFSSPEAANTPGHASPGISDSPQKTGRLNQLFSSFLFMPDGMRFETQEPGETIVLLLRKHWYVNMSWIFMAIILIFIPLLFFPIFSFDEFFQNLLPTSFMIFAIFVWYLLTFSYILVNFLLWYFNVAIVTSERIIDIDYHNILNKEFSATRISKVEDVTMKSTGFLNALFNFGDVHVQTAASEAQFEFLSIPKPQQVVRIINKLMGKE